MWPSFEKFQFKDVEGSFFGENGRTAVTVVSVCVLQCVCCDGKYSRSSSSGSKQKCELPASNCEVRHSDMVL